MEKCQSEKSGSVTHPFTLFLSCRRLVLTRSNIFLGTARTRQAHYWPNLKPFSMAIRLPEFPRVNHWPCARLTSRSTRRELHKHQEPPKCKVPFLSVEKMKGKVTHPAGSLRQDETRALATRVPWPQVGLCFSHVLFSVLLPSLPMFRPSFDPRRLFPHASM